MTEAVTVLPPALMALAMAVAAAFAVQRLVRGRKGPAGD
jgi:hypothetical protein